MHACLQSATTLATFLACTHSTESLGGTSLPAGLLALVAVRQLHRLAANQKHRHMHMMRADSTEAGREEPHTPQKYGAHPYEASAHTKMKA